MLHAYRYMDERIMPIKNFENGESEERKSKSTRVGEASKIKKTSLCDTSGSTTLRVANKSLKH